LGVGPLCRCRGWVCGRRVLVLAVVVLCAWVWQVICLACNGVGWLFRRVDVSHIYGHPHTAEVARVCWYCHGKRFVELLDASSKMAQANDAAD
jgi:hypothetical protein